MPPTISQHGVFMLRNREILGEISISHLRAILRREEFQPDIAWTEILGQCTGRLFQMVVRVRIGDTRQSQAVWDVMLPTE